MVMLPWTDYDDSSYCDLYDPTGSYLAYYISCKYIHDYPSHWQWIAWERKYDIYGEATDVGMQTGCEYNRTSAKNEAERWFLTNVGEIG